MKRSDKPRTLLHALLCALAVSAAALTGCVERDDTLGANLVPDNQQLKAGYVSLPALPKSGAAANPRKYVETRLFQTDSIRASNISNGYMGTMFSDTLGQRTAGFLTQYVSYYKVDEGYFGFRPIFDSAQLLLSINAYGSDTLTEQTFAVYEITSNEYLRRKPLGPGKSQRDTAFYLDFNPRDVSYLEGADKNIVGEKLFTFTLGGDNGPSKAAVTMTPTSAGREFVKRLMLHGDDYVEGTPIDYSVYDPEHLDKWVERFKGLYIEPETRFTASKDNAPQGTIYTTDLSATGLSIYGRNRREEDPTLIKDTIGMVYYFYDSYQSEFGNVSINVVDRNYDAATSPAKISLDDAREYLSKGTLNPDRPENPRAYVEGMGGVITELTLTGEFFDELEHIIADENAASGKDFSTLAFSRACISFYFPSSSHDWTQIDPTNPGRLIEEMSGAPSRLGLYTDYKSLTAIADYLYVYENTYGTSISYGGYINRSRGCYVMDITGYLQEVWNSYLQEKRAAETENRAVELKNVANRTIYLGPEAYSLFSVPTTVLQGEADASNPAPIRFDLTYNLLK